MYRSQEQRRRGQRIDTTLAERQSFNERKRVGTISCQENELRANFPLMLFISYKYKYKYK